MFPNCSRSRKNEIPYTYYAQIKESGKNPTVEYIRKFDGRFVGER